VKRTINKTERVDDIMCAVSSPADMDMAEQDAVNLLRARHDLDPEEPDDFEIQQPVEAVQLRAATSRKLAMLLVAMGAVSLVVGGVGIMNIMLVAVTERRREIGIRLAIGARMRDVRLQFLLEAAAIGAGGAALGAGAGVLLSRALASGLGTTAVVSPSLVGFVALAGVLTGLVFGYLPAHQASALDPLEAIRAEN
jgi:putative ABC transport system permease protein